MIRTYHKIAIALLPLRYLLALLAFLSLSCSVYLLIDEVPQYAQYQLPSLLLGIWLLLLMALSYLFAQLPERPGAEMGWWRRTLLRIKGFLSFTLALLFTGLSLTLILLSIKATALF